MRIAEHEAVFRVPQHEGFRDGLDRVAQPQVGLHGLLGQALLFGDVDRDADQVQAAVGRGLAELAAHPQPDPVAVDMLHAEGLVDVVELAGDHLIGDRKQVDVVGFHQRVDFAEGEEVVAGVEPSNVNIDADQKILPRERSQSHRPQRPRLSAVSIRPRTAALMRSPSRARVDCQWKAKPRISTTKPVVADSVTDNAASEPHSGSFFSWIRMTWPGSDLTSREIAMAPLPFGSVISLTTPCWLEVVSSWAVLMMSRMRSLPPRPPSTGRRARIRWSAPVMMTWRPPATPQPGIISGSRPCNRSRLAARSCRTAAKRSRRSANRSVSAERSRFIAARFCRLWSITCTKAPRQMVIRNAMMSVGSARRSAGSATSSRW